MLSIEVWRAPTPIPRPVLTVVGVYDTYFHLVVIVREGDVSGWGMSGMATLAHLDDGLRLCRWSGQDLA